MEKEYMPTNGTKVKLIITGYFNNDIEIEGTIIGEPYQHGYRTVGGGWGLHDISEYGYKSVPSYRINLKPKRKKLLRIIDLDDIKSCEVLNKK